MNQTRFLSIAKYPLRAATVALLWAAMGTTLWGCAAPYTLPEKSRTTSPKAEMGQNFSEELYLLVDPAADSAAQQEETFVLDPSLSSGAISGVVLGKDGPLEGASVRVQTASTEFLTGEDGAFTIPDLVASGPVTITAWAKSYFIEAAGQMRTANPPSTHDFCRFIKGLTFTATAVRSRIMKRVFHKRQIWMKLILARA